jgi:hypothetical protein
LFSLLPLSLTSQLDVIRIPNEASIDLKRNARSSRELSSKTGQSVSCSSHTPETSRDFEKFHFGVKNGPWSPEDQEEVILFRGNLALQSHEQRQMWMLRKRGSSDRPSQPFPAPSGFEAQKADNFRKFYAAVISPTHLRVTAGGRIVPNTRGLPHPAYTWNAEKQFFESTDRNSSSVLERQKSWLLDTNLSVAEPPSPYGMVRSTIDDFFGPPLHSNSSIRSAAPNKENDAHSSDVVAPDAIAQICTEDIVSPSESDSTLVHGQVKISPPGQFDVFRPFFINGQPYYPAPTGIQAPANIPVLPFNILGNLNPSYQPLLHSYGMLQPASLQLPAGNFGYPQPLTVEDQQMGQQIPLVQTSGFPASLMSPQLHAPDGQPFSMVQMMHMPSLPNEQAAIHPQAVLILNQIQALQQQLKHLENQLLHYKHQIDEQHVIYQQNHVENQIRSLQSSLNAHFSQSNFLPHDQYGSSMWNIGLGAMGVPLAPITNSGAIPTKADSPGTSLVYLNGYDASVQNKNMPENMEAVVKAALRGGNSQVDDPQDVQVSMPPGPKNLKRLSAAAAMAPEFQPRSQVNIANQSAANETEFLETSAKDNPAVIDHTDLRKKAETEPPYNVTSWSTPGQWSSSNLMHGTPAVVGGHTMHHLTKGNPFTQSSAIGNCRTPVSLNGVAATVQNRPSNANGVNSYLMGYPPAGIPANSVESADMIYSRELTREELQARQLYWGKAPRALSKELPEFDGKDFYAPSPEKPSVSPRENRSYRKNRSSRRSNTSNTIPGPHSPKSVPSQVTLTLHCEFEDPQDRSENSDGVEQIAHRTLAERANSSPGNDTASLDAWGMAKTDEEEIFDRPAHLTSSFKSTVANSDDNNMVNLETSVSR